MNSKNKNFIKMSQLYLNDNNQQSIPFLQQISSSSSQQFIPLLQSPSNNQKFIVKKDEYEKINIDETKDVLEGGMYNFWNGIKNAIIKDNFLILPENTYFNGELDNGSLIYVRNSYKELYELMFNPNLKDEESLSFNSKTFNRYKRFIISGTPGIGKSQFAFYIIYLLLKDGKTIIWNHHKKKDKVYIFNNDFIKIGGQSLLSNVDLVNPNIIYLVDSIRPNIGNVKTILFTSPDKSIYKYFKKENGLLLYMPIWTWDEIFYTHSNISRYNEIPIQKIFDLFLKCGGVPRSLFIEIEGAIKNLDDAIRSSDIKSMIYSVGTSQQSKDTSNLVVHHTVVENTTRKIEYDKYTGKTDLKPAIAEKYINPILRFASDYVAEEILTNIKIMANDDAKYFLIASIGSDKGMLGSIRGHMFEAFAHRQLSRGGDFKIKSLIDENNFIQTESIFPIKRKNAKIFYNTSQIISLGPDDYGLPITKNYQSIDSLIIDNNLYLFQMTVSNSHPVQQQQLLNIINYFPGNNKDIYLIFVVPDDIKCNWKYKQSYLTEHQVVSQRVPKEIQDRVKQYVIGLDLLKPIENPNIC
jgi:hypothetical protein